MNKLSLVLPCYNEMELIGGNLKLIINALEEKGIDYEIVVGNDGSEDSTKEIVEKFISENPAINIRLFNSPVHRGKGSILTEAFQATTGNLLAFLDADLEIDISNLFPIIEHIKNGADISVGCKVLHSDWKQRPFSRKAATNVYNLLVRLILGSKLLDHQAGIKAFRREAILDILQSVKTDRWTWDTEILVYAQKKGYRIKEVPVGTTFRRRSKINMLTKPFEMATEVIRLYLRGVRVR